VWFAVSVGGDFWQQATSSAIVMIVAIAIGPDRFRANELRESVFKIVEVFAAFNLDRELAGYSFQLFCA